VDWLLVTSAENPEEIGDRVKIKNMLRIIFSM